MMKIAYHLTLFIAFAFMATGFTGLAKAQGEMRDRPALVIFYAQNCGACKILEPKLEEARASLLDNALETIVFDYSTRETIEASKALAGEKDLTALQRKIGAKTGFAVLIDKNGREIDSLTISDSAEDMAAAIKAVL